MTNTNRPAENCYFKRIGVELNAYRRHLLDRIEIQKSTKGVSKIIIDGVSPQTKPSSIYAAAAKFDLCELLIDSNENLSRCAQWQIHSVQLDMTADRGYKKGPISSVMHAGIYFTIDMAGYSCASTRRMWIYNVRNLLNLCSKKNIIVVFNEEKYTEEEVLEIFLLFKIKKRVAVKFLSTNVENMLITAAMKKYAYKGAIIRMEENESSFKKLVYRATKPLKSIKK
ncbi:hypothetical protein NEIRO03_1761 [Nematocida sp. AWRm78]|nr:hypothetical protein NEIRO03_1761 [Nematocida sp. AWRm78]